MFVIFSLLLLAIPAAPPTYSAANLKAWNILRQGAQDKSAARRLKAIHSLALVKDREAQSMVEAALNDPDREIRSEAAHSIGRMEDRAARPKLHACLNDKEVQVVLACTNALYLLKDPTAYEVYYALLTGDRKTSKGLVQSQLDILHDRKQMEKLVFEAGLGFVPFGGMGWQAIKTITHDDISPIRALAAERLATDPDPRSAQALTAYLTEKKTRVREAVVEAIAMRDDPALLKTIIVLLDDDNENVRYDAAAAVIRLSRRRTPSRPKAPPAVQP